tara:strand:- start:312 stop:1037 length:726 start_codon:yes stop_codon:yes gene_type:complete
MTDAYNEGNLENQGQPGNDVGHDEGQTQGESSNWEEQAKYFQSEKDKLANENQNLKKYEAIGNLLRSRPDIAQTVATMVQGGQVANPAQPQQIELSQDEFDPWEAYNDPKSKSYQFRQQELQNSINQAVGQKMAGVQRQQGMQQLQTKLAQQGLTEPEIQSFMQFASKNPGEYGVDGAIKMWKAVMNEGSQGTEPSPLDSVRQTQGTPTPGGILQGHTPQVQNDRDAAWEAVMSADDRKKF